MNRIVDISAYIDQKVRGNVANKGKGPAGTAGSRLRLELAREGKKLPLLGDDDDTAEDTGATEETGGTETAADTATAAETGGDTGTAAETEAGGTAGACCAAGLAGAAA